ncbi:hypothetical protein DFH09DRAFT_1304113 [Mycena vulgaris]|nr:hypothetical protein DFH09DRAFT_1304113 [Mycena vulgaris]
MNGRSIYRWILMLLRENRAVITYTRGHSADVPAPLRPPYGPIPTFAMDDYTFYRAADGWTEANICQHVFVDFFLASEMAVILALGNRMCIGLHTVTVFTEVTGAVYGSPSRAVAKIQILVCGTGAADPSSAYTRQRAV